MTTRTRLIVAGMAVVVAAAGWGGLRWWQVRADREILAAAIPATPDSSSWSDELRGRIADSARRARAGDNPVAALGELARLYHANGFFPEAIQCYGALEQLDPHEARWPHRHAVILAGFGEAEPALALWRRVVKLAPGYLPARLRLGDVLSKTNQLEAASDVYRGILADQPGEAYATLALARIDVEAGRWEAARPQLEAVFQQTGQTLGYDLIVTVYERLGMNDRAAEIRGQARASGAYRDPPDPWMDELFSDCYDLYRLSLAAGEANRTGDPATAVRRLERALQLAPDNSSIHFQLGTTLVEQRQFTRAREHLVRCTQLAPELADGWAHLHALLQTVGDRTAAGRALAEGLRQCPNSPGLHLTQARQLRNAGQLDGAIEEFKTSIRLRSNEADAYLELAGAYFTVGRAGEAVVELEKALAAEPGQPTALASLAAQAISSGDEAAARKWLRQARLQPRVPAGRLARMLEAFHQKFGHAPE